jgi:hypothetical protein
LNRLALCLARYGGGKFGGHEGTGRFNAHLLGQGCAFHPAEGHDIVADHVSTLLEKHAVPQARVGTDDMRILEVEARQVAGR